MDMVDSQILDGEPPQRLIDAPIAGTVCARDSKAEFLVDFRPVCDRIQAIRGRFLAEKSSEIPMKDG
jgi:hypothetical protein